MCRPRTLSSQGSCTSKGKVSTDGSFARGSAIPELPHPERNPYVRFMDPLSVLIGWAEKVIGGFRQTARADLRIADQARLLRRQLAASFEEWPQGPKTNNELLTWAHKTARGFGVTQLGIDALVGLRPDASRPVRRAIGAARDDYYDAADLISAATKTTWQVKGGYAGTEPVDVVPLRKAFALLKRCVKRLDEVVATKGAQ